MAWVQAKQIARAILSGFERHYCLFQEITAGAQERFERADWQSAQAATRERIHFYDQRVAETVELLQRNCEVAALDEPLWQRVKVEYVRLLHQHLQPL